MLESTDKNDYNLGLTKGSCLPVKVQKIFTADKVLSAGILKHSNHDHSFCSSEDYLLLFTISRPENGYQYSMEWRVIYGREV